MRVNARPRNRASELAIEIFERTLNAIQPERLVREALRLDSGLLFVQDVPYDLSLHQRLRIVGVGKAAVGMARGAMEVLGDRVEGGLLIAPDPATVPGLEVIVGSHPLPDATSLIAGQRLFEEADASRPGDFVLFLLSGGASSLAEIPAGDLTIEEIRSATLLLLSKGVDIVHTNAVRARLSRIKGGRLAGRFGGATVVALVLSDVVSGEVASVGSGPLLEPPKVGIDQELFELMPDAVRAELLSADLLPRSIPTVSHYVIGSVSLAVHAAGDVAQHLGLERLLIQDPLQGEARKMSRKIMRVARRLVSHQPDRAFCLIFGGETTVHLRGKGRGGRCQEMALAAANAMKDLPDSALLAGGTDGIDGLTDAAGGWVDSQSVELAERKGFNTRRALIQNDSYRFLRACEGLIHTGPTGTNVNDLCVFVHVPPSF